MCRYIENIWIGMFINDLECVRSARFGLIQFNSIVRKSYIWYSSDVAVAVTNAALGWYSAGVCYCNSVCPEQMFHSMFCITADMLYIYMITPLKAHQIQVEHISEHLHINYRFNGCNLNAYRIVLYWCARQWNNTTRWNCRTNFVLFDYQVATFKPHSFEFQSKLEWIKYNNAEW